MKDSYNLCWECFNKRHGFYMARVYSGEAGLAIGIGGICDVCQKEIKKEETYDFSRE